MVNRGELETESYLLLSIFHSLAHKQNLGKVLFVRSGGFEPPTPGFGGLYSIH